MTRRKRKVPLLKRYRLRFARKRPPTVMWEALLVVLFGAVMIYTYSFAKKITVGATADSSEPAEVVRVQMLNGCGVKGAAHDAAEFLLAADDAEYQIDIVDRGNFATFDVTETLILDRGDARDAARYLADLMGVDDQHVLTQPLMENVLEIDVSVLLGRDVVTLGLRPAQRRP